MPNELPEAPSLQPPVGYLSGQWLPIADMRIPIGDLGFLQAVTAVERLRTYAGKLFQTAAHLDRLQNTLQFLGISVSTIQITQLLQELVARNAAWLASEGDFGVTIFVTPGGLVAPGGPDKAAPTIGLHCHTIDHQWVAHRIATGQPIVVTNIQQPSPRSWPRRLKVRCRMHYYLADQAARNYHPDALGVLLDDDGTLTETSTANLAVVCDQVIMSPPPARILPGITQRFLESYACQQGIPWIYRPLPESLLEQADEILLFGSTTGVWNGWLADAAGSPQTGHTMSERLRAAFPS